MAQHKPQDHVIEALCHSPCPGFETVWGYLSRTEPHSLAFMLNPVEGLEIENQKGWEISFELGLPVVPLKRDGEGRPLGAFTREVLEKVFPANP